MRAGSGRVLVVVAHPDDETLSFSSVCPGADVALVTNGNWLGRGAARAGEFRAACRLLGVRSALRFELPDLYPHPLPHDELLARLRGLGRYDRVYTHSPLDSHPHHRSVSLAAAEAFQEAWIPAQGCRPTEVAVLDDDSFAAKLGIMNTVYFKEIFAPDQSYELQSQDIGAVEAFSRVSYPEVVRALALTRHQLRPELPDVWGFETSPYEAERLDLTCRLLAEAIPGAAPWVIIEVGACEGSMTERLSTAFPAARVQAVEPHPVFAGRLRRRIKHCANVEVIEADAVAVDLKADVITFAEVLYYLVPEAANRLLARAEAKHLLTSNYPGYDDQVVRWLSSLGWRESKAATLPPRFEPIDSRSSIIARRVGTTIRMWRRLT
ncbi:MAG: PIG-L family deacetylase [Desulfobacteraceae bacterium]|nr:PIG-L family deacetylase [Desulfobacteraceae bacterium]